MPAMRPTSRAHRPPALTTCSATIVPLSVITSHVPSVARQLRDTREAIDLRAQVARGFRICLRDAGRIDVPFERVVQRADEMLLSSNGKSRAASSTEMISMPRPR